MSIYRRDCKSPNYLLVLWNQDPFIAEVRVHAALQEGVLVWLWGSIMRWGVIALCIGGLAFFVGFFIALVVWHHRATLHEESIHGDRNQTIIVITKPNALDN